MKIKQIVVLVGVLLFLGVANASGQATRHRTKRHGRFQEEFDVLKKDKHIKQGQYARFRMDILDRLMPVEFGQYAHNERTGLWYSFYGRGPLKSYGFYVNGKKQGEWREYNLPLLDNDEIFDMLAGKSAAHVGKDGKLTVEKDDKELAAVGNYTAGKKSGIWKYYAQGVLIHKYDYSSHQLVYSSLPDSVNLDCPYLGGQERFFNQFISISEQIEHTAFQKNSRVDLRMDVNTKPATIEVIHQQGYKEFAGEVIRILRKIPDEWIPSLVDHPLYFTAKISDQDSSQFKGVVYSMSHEHFADTSWPKVGN
jgi:hypothetical protein